ncbi:hypothetical protein SLS54_004915 [Diplodia seriata]
MAILPATLIGSLPPAQSSPTYCRMAANRRFASLLDGMGAIFAPRPRDHAFAYDSDSAYHRPRTSRRPRRNTFDHDTRHEPAYAAAPPPKPDLDHLRQARAAYYAPPPELAELADPRSGRRPSAASVALSSHPPTPPPPPVPVPDLPDMEPRLTRAASTRKTSRSKRQQPDERRPSRKEREDRDSGVYVYSTPRSGDSRSRREEDLGDTRSRAGGAHRRAVSSPATNIIDVEVEREPEPEPEPSVRRADGARLNRYVLGISLSSEPGR